MSGLSALAGLPAGVGPLPFSGSVVPSGWLICDGLAVSRATYAGLFAAISTVFGAGDGSTTFNVPDMRGRSPVGKDNMGGSAALRVTVGGSGIAGGTLGASGGAETVTLAEAQIPSHVHQQRTYDGTPFANGGAAASVNNQVSAAGTTTPVNTVATGGGGVHQNMTPTLIVNYIIKA